jgi:hypothetical protein
VHVQGSEQGDGTVAPILVLNAQRPSGIGRDTELRWAVTIPATYA